MGLLSIASAEAEGGRGEREGARCHSQAKARQGKEEHCSCWRGWWRWQLLSRGDTGAQSRWTLFLAAEFGHRAWNPGSGPAARDDGSGAGDDTICYAIRTAWKLPSSRHSTGVSERFNLWRAGKSIWCSIFSSCTCCLWISHCSSSSKWPGPTWRDRGIRQRWADSCNLDVLWRVASRRWCQDTTRRSGPRRFHTDPLLQFWRALLWQRSRQHRSG